LSHGGRATLRRKIGVKRSRRERSQIFCASAFVRLRRSSIDAAGRRAKLPARNVSRALPRTCERVIFLGRASACTSND
jgi:hypothetical protein